MTKSQDTNDSRIELLAGDDARRAAEQIGVPLALAELNIFRALLHNRELAKSLSDLLLSLLFRASLDDRLRELVIMRIGWATHSCYEWTQHWRIAQEQFGCSERELLALRSWRDSDGFGEAERAVLAATDEMLASGTLSAETFAQCRAQLGTDQACLELVASIGTWHWVSQLTRSLEIPLEEGVAPWPPKGEAPAGPSATEAAE